MSASAFNRSEMMEFLQLPQSPPRDVYVWSNAIKSADNIVHVPGSNVPNGIALKDVAAASQGASLDYELLSCGWSMADAVIGSGAILRGEAMTVWADVSSPERPIAVVVSPSGQVPLDHRMFTFQSDHKQRCGAVIVTSERGLLLLRNAAIDADMCVDDFHGDDSTTIRLSSAALRAPLVVTAAFVRHDGDEFTVDYDALVRWLSCERGVRRIEVTSSSRILGDMMRAGLVDEIRYTVSGQVLGRAPDRRAWCDVEPPFQVGKSPLLEFINVRMLPHHLFVRAKVIYRHRE
jgi:riboflavin biosynthesis pyrimidine reductase